MALPVLPLVLYHGKGQRWNAAQDIHDLLGTRPAALAKYGPKVHYLLLDEGSYSESQLAPLLLKNLVAAVFQLENSRTVQDFQGVLEAMEAWLKDPSQQELNRDLTDWITKVLLSQRLPGVTFKELTNLQELKTMLAERIDSWQEQWKTAGMAEGRAKGRAEGQVLLLNRLLEDQFGPLDPDLQKYLYHLDEKAVLDCVKRTFTAKSVQEVIGQ